MKKLFVPVFCVVFTSLVQAQVKPTFTFNHLALAVKNVNASAEFYKSVFQLQEITNRTANPNIRWISMNDGKELHLIFNAEPVRLNKSVHLAFTTNDLDAFQKHLTRLNIAYGDWDGTVNSITVRADGVKQIYLQDPDGYWIEINNAAKSNN